MGPSLPAAPRSSHILSPPSRPLTAFISGHGSSSDCRKEGLGCGKRGSKLPDLLPLPGLLLLSTGSTSSSDSPCSSPLSPLHASRLACVHLRGEEHKTAPLTTSPCCSATPSGALPPPQPSTLSPEPAAHQREVTRLPDSPGPEPQERQLTLQGQGRGRQEQVLPWGNACARCTGETLAYAWE